MNLGSSGAAPRRLVSSHLSLRTNLQTGGQLFCAALPWRVRSHADNVLEPDAAVSSGKDRKGEGLLTRAAARLDPPQSRNRLPPNGTYLQRSIQGGH